MSQMYDLMNIKWQKEAKHIKLTNEEFMNLYEKLNKDRKQINLSNKRYLFNEDTYALYRNKNNKDILAIYLYDGPKDYKIYFTNTYDDQKNTREEYAGPKAYKLLSNKFKELTGKSLNEAFGSSKEDFKRCVPKQFCYYNPEFANKELLLSSIDACSQYPANLRGQLPDARTAKVVEGTVEPNEEYRFAYYLRSGHIAEYQVFDTHNWYKYDQRLWGGLFRIKRKNEKIQWEFRQDLTGDKDLTILMKPSRYELTDTLNYFYEQKEKIKDHDSQEYKDAKLVMNAAIGMFHMRKYDRNKYAHLAAICIARANQKILEMAKKINVNYIAQIVVDGILYCGPRFGVTGRQFGSFNQEFDACHGLISGYNKFIVMENGKIIKFKQGNCNKTENGKDIVKEDIKDLRDQYKWYLDDPMKELRHYEQEESI